MKTPKCLSLFLLIGHIIFTSQVAAGDVINTRLVHNEVVKGHDVIQEPSSDNMIVPRDIWGILKKIFEPYTSDFKKPIWQNGYTKVALEFGDASSIPTKSAVDFKTIQELEVLRGSSTEAQTMIRALTVLSSDQTSSLTLVGQKTFAEMASMPGIPMDELRARRDFIKALYDNPTLLDEITELLKTIKDAEPYMIDFCGKEGISDVEKAAYPSIIVRALGLGNIPSAIDASNRFWMFQSSPLFLPTMVTGALFGANIYKASQAYQWNWSWHVASAAEILKGTAKVSYEINTDHVLRQNIMLTCFSVITLGVVKSITHAIKHMQERVIGYATYMRAAQRLMTLVKNNPALLVLMPEVEQCVLRLNGDDETVSDDHFYANELLMQASTFNEGEPSLFSSPGNILCTYRYLSDKNVRKEYDPIIRTVGNIDVYATLAQKMRQHDQYKNARFCFVDFIENADKPMLIADDVWHPFLDAQHAVSNSFKLNEDTERNMLITGPNTGGKSTNMKAIAVSVLLAQTFGIAPASSMRMTPFSVISTYLNVIDDTSAGLSLFKAEVKRVQELMDAVKNLSAGQFAFVMLDEIFTGTSPDKAEELSYGCMKKLSELDHTIFVCATHFKKLTGLEAVTNGVTKNYQVEVITDEAGRIAKYTYKIVPGISKISSAQQVAEETGLVF